MEHPFGLDHPLEEYELRGMEYLKRMAACRQTVSHEMFRRAIRLPGRHVHDWRFPLQRILGLILKRCADEHDPLLPVLVINPQTGDSGQGFYDYAAELGIADSSVCIDSSKTRLNFWLEEFAKCIHDYQYYGGE